MVTRLSAIAAFLLLAPGVAAQTGTLTGRVIDAQSGEPIPAVQVVLNVLDVGVLTRENGAYMIPGLPVGSQAVTAQLVGYGSVTVSVTIADRQTSVLDFRLTQQPLQVEPAGQPSR
jgi:hypothetical protein